MLVAVSVLTYLIQSMHVIKMHFVKSLYRFAEDLSILFTIDRISSVHPSVCSVVMP